MSRFTTSLLLLFLVACSRFVPTPTPTFSPQEIQGRRVFDSFCSRCHSTNADTVVVGPSLAGIATRGYDRIKGMDAEAYIRSSILDPKGYTVEGFPKDSMPGSLVDEIGKEDLEAVIAYLLTLK